MPVLHVVKRFVSVPDTWEGWAMRVLTVGIVITICASWILLQETAALREQVRSGRSERQAFQIEQAERTCAVLRTLTKDPRTMEAARC